jgi:acylphosphatase
MRVARIFTISGEVQGVGFRFFAQRAAARHQVVGYVRNLPDGRVESLAEGPPESVEAFKHDLATGPQSAFVQQVEEVSIEPRGTYPTFRIER